MIRCVILHLIHLFVKMSGSSEAAGGKKLALVFLRYYGCTLCQYDLSQYAKNYEKITAAGGELLVVLQSDPDLLREDMGKEDMFPV